MFPLILLGILIDLHTPGSGSPQDLNLLQSHCGALNLPAVQYVLAARWAAEVINNQSVTQGIKFGKSFNYIKYQNRSKTRRCFITIALQYAIVKVQKTMWD
jgi:hypothetical protein